MEAEHHTPGIIPDGLLSEGSLVTAVTCLRSINPNVGSFDEIRATDARVGSDINKASINGLEAALRSFNVSEHFPAYLAVLHASMAAAKRGDARVQYFISVYIRLAMGTSREYAAMLPHRWAGAGRHAARLAMESGNIQLALSLVVPLREAAAKLAPSKDHIVPLHADFLAVCLESKSFDAAAEWARRKRLLIDPEKTGLEATDVLLAYYYAAHAYVGLKKFRLALHCTRIALAVPVYPSGKIPETVIAVYKKFILLNILVNGCAPKPLKFSSYSASRVRNIVSEYTELAVAYQKKKVDDIHDVVELHKLTFRKDSNLGLVKQVANSLSRKIIKQLSTCYVTIEIDTLVKRAGLHSREHAEHVLLEMIGDGSIEASLDGKLGIVRLGQKEDVQESAQVHQYSKSLDSMDQRMQRCLLAMKRIQVFRNALVVDPMYAKKEASHRRQRATKKAGVSFVNEDSEMPTRPSVFESEAEL